MSGGATDGSRGLSSTVVAIVIAVAVVVGGSVAAATGLVTLGVVGVAMGWDESSRRTPPRLRAGPPHRRRSPPRPHPPRWRRPRRVRCRRPPPRHPPPRPRRRRSPHRRRSPRPPLRRCWPSSGRRRRHHQGPGGRGHRAVCASSASTPPSSRAVSATPSRRRAGCRASCSPRACGWSATAARTTATATAALLRHVQLADGRQVARILIAGGYGEEYTYDRAVLRAGRLPRRRGVGPRGEQGHLEQRLPHPAAAAPAGTCLIKGNIAERRREDLPRARAAVLRRHEDRRVQGRAVVLLRVHAVAPAGAGPSADARGSRGQAVAGPTPVIESTTSPASSVAARSSSAVTRQSWSPSGSSRICSTTQWSASSVTRNSAGPRASGPVPTSSYSAR